MSPLGPVLLQDRRGRQDATTALAFSAAATFLDACHVFNQPLTDEARVSAAFVHVCFLCDADKSHRASASTIIFSKQAQCDGTAESEPGCGLRMWDAQVEAKLKFAAWRAADLSRTLALDQKPGAAVQAPAAAHQPQAAPVQPSSPPPPPPQISLQQPPPQVPQQPLPPAPGPAAAPAPPQQQPPAPPPPAGYPSAYPSLYPNISGLQQDPAPAQSWLQDASSAAVTPSPTGFGGASAPPQPQPQPADGGPWRPLWGVGVAQLAAGDRVLYRTQGDSFVIASIVQVPLSCELFSGPSQCRYFIIRAGFSRKVLKFFCVYFCETL